MTSGWIDISVPLVTGMVRWPGDPTPRISRISDLKKGDTCTVSYLEMAAHTGTHMDAPAHYFQRGKTIDDMPLDAALGPARVIRIRNPKSVTARELSRHRIRPGERVLFKTRNSLRCWRTNRFVKDFVSVSPDAARYLAAREVGLVGIDYISVGSYLGGGEETHRLLLGAGVWLLEGLDLTDVRQGPVELVCLPLRIMQADGAPARALVRERRRKAKDLHL